MINSVNLIGRMVKDPELRYSKNGKAVCNFTLAVNRNFKNQNGEREADFINHTQFGKGAELTAQYTGKGSQVGTSGRIQTRNYENSEGRRVYITEVVAEQVAFLDSKGGGQQQKPDNDFKPIDNDDTGGLPF